MKILVVDDEERIRDLICDYLHKEDYNTLEAENGEQALALFQNEQDIDLIILDVMMPEMDGWTVCRELRKLSDVPVFMLTARVDTSDEVYGFELGVDDYIKKPFSPRSLVARVKALEKKKQGRDILDAGALTVNKTGRYVLLNKEKLDLPPKEYDLLLLLMENRGRALSREQILDSVWDFQYYKGMRTIDTHIKKLRKKLGDYANYIETVRNFGYRFEADEL
ncbi:MAG: response regulator transcription factor [Spirochaetales bacterium]|nr:response regulator transcription factor [Spirochaetales bacterium]